MVIRLVRFNLKLLLAVGLLALAGCQSPEARQARQPATLRIHLETNPNPPGHSDQILVLRDAPIAINIEKSPFLNEAHVAAARVLDTTAGFIVSIQFNQQGQWLLEQYSAANPNRRYAIRTQFRQNTNAFDRWIAAPLISHRITDGVINFTPDADRTEAEIFVQGWNNVAGYKPKAKEAKPKFSEVP